MGEHMKLGGKCMWGRREEEREGKEWGIFGSDANIFHACINTK